LTARGNEQRLTFRDDRDRDHFLELLAQWVDRFRLRVHVLMPNHYHLLAETTRGQSLPGDAMAQRQLHRLVQSPPPARGPLVPGSFQVSHRRVGDVGQALLGSRDFIQELTKRVRGTRAEPFARALAEEAESYLSNVQS